MIDKRIFQFPILYTNILDKVAIGWGVHETVADECKQAGIKKAMVVTTGLEGTGIVEEILGILKYNGISTVIYDKITSNPKDYEVMEGYKVFKDTQCDGVISIGGGSSHDAGKAIRAVEANGGVPVSQLAVFIDPPWMETVKKYKPITIPQITVNTTAGTGAELTYASVITNTKTRAKELILVPRQTPTAALIDPLLVRLMSQQYAAWTGFDALTHAFESYISRVQSKYSNALFLETMRLVSENVREFSYNRMNHKACENMCYAESMAGIAIVLGAGGGIVHGMAHSLSVLTGCHHGRANAVMALAGERYNQPSCPEKFAEMTRAMGVDTRGMTVAQASDRWFDEIERLLTDLNIQPGNLGKQFGLKKEDFEHMIKVYSNDWVSEGNARPYNHDECLKLLESVF
jgi:formaldehyde dismutase / methanol dehydrogenase